MLRKRFGLPSAVGEAIYYGRPDQYFQSRRPGVCNRLRAKLNIADDDVVCLTTARLEEVKGHQFLIAAMARLRQLPLWQRLRFVWIGAGSLQKSLTGDPERAGLSDRVHLLGPRWDVADWLDAADMFVLTSLAEGMPLAIMEAMAKGLPVMATAVSGIPEELGYADLRLTFLHLPHRGQRGTSDL